MAKLVTETENMLKSTSKKLDNELESELITLELKLLQN